VLEPVQVMRSYRSTGGTGPEAVVPMLEGLQKSVGARRARLEVDQARVQTAYEACRSIARSAAGVSSAGDLDRLIQRHCPARGKGGGA
jgi:hypothetical protein